MTTSFATVVTLVLKLVPGHLREIIVKLVQEPFELFALHAVGFAFRVSLPQLNLFVIHLILGWLPMRTINGASDFAHVDQEGLAGVCEA